MVIIPVFSFCKDHEGIYLNLSMLIMHVMLQWMIYQKWFNTTANKIWIFSFFLGWAFYMYDTEEA